MLHLAFAVLVSAPCYDRDVLAGYLASRGMPLHSWGLTSGGDQHELFLAPSGEWAVVQTTPTGCATLVSTPDRHLGRLWNPPQQNRAVPRPRRMSPGEAM